MKRENPHDGIRGRRKTLKHEINQIQLTAEDLLRQNYDENGEAIDTGVIINDEEPTVPDRGKRMIKLENWVSSGQIVDDEEPTVPDRGKRMIKLENWVSSGQIVDPGPDPTPPLISKMTIADRAMLVEEDVNFHNIVTADIDLLWANNTPLKDILFYLYDSEKVKCSKIFQLEASKFYFNLLVSEYSYNDIILDDMYTLDYFLSKPPKWFKCYMPKGAKIAPHYEAASEIPAVLLPDKLVISSSYGLLSKFQEHHNHNATFEGLWKTFKDTLYSIGYFMETWYYEISTVIHTESNMYEKIDTINNEFLSQAETNEKDHLIEVFTDNPKFNDVINDVTSDNGRILEAYELLSLKF